MNTPAHLLLGAAMFGRAPKTSTLVSALIGGALPDASLYLMAGVSLFILDISPSVVFNQLYFSDAWQTVFAIDNSFLVWGVLCGLAVVSGKAWAIALTGAALLHVVMDFPLHHDDGRPHFWPISWWVFESPVSYWDTRHGASWVAPLEAMLAVISAIYVFRRGLPFWAMPCIFFLVLAELWIVRQWLFFFSG